jgi:GAF domain-containing protein/CheY-like chemotaxis protein
MKSEIKKPSILVVDDEPDNLDLLYRTFHREFKVIRAENGPAALDLLATVEVAVIISDQRMPLMSGTEFLSLAASQYPDTMRIILTGYTDVVDLVEAINSGKVFKYVTKPWDEEELKAVVQQAVDTHNVLQTRTQELRRTLRQESLLNAVTNTIRQAPNYQQLLQTIVATVGQMFEVDCCILRSLQDEELQHETFIYQAARLAEPIASDLLKHTLWKTQDVLVIDDIATTQINSDPTSFQASAYQQAGITASLIVPLIYKQDLMAILALHQCGQPRQWQSDEVQLVLMVADQAAPALSQALAYEQSQALAKREALVNTITAAIRSSLDPQAIFAAITQQLGQALHVDGCALSLWTAEDEFVQCVGLHDATQTPAQTPAQIPADLTSLSPTPTASPLSPASLVDHGLAATATLAPTLSPPGLDSNRDPNHQSNRELNREPNRSELPQSFAPIEGNPVLQQLLLTQSPVVVNDLSQRNEMNVSDLPLRSSARALLVVPLLYDGKIIGSIATPNPSAPLLGTGRSRASPSRCRPGRHRRSSVASL